MLAVAVGGAAWPMVAGAPVLFWVSSTLLSAPLMLLLVWAAAAIRPVTHMVQQESGLGANVVLPWHLGAQYVTLAGPPSMQRWPSGQTCFLSIPAVLHGRHVWLLMVLSTDTAERYMKSRSVDS
jgi:hypothetical protein